MSRGPGHVERRILDLLRDNWVEFGETSAGIAAEVYGVRERRFELILGGPELTGAQLGSVRRALRRLEKRGLIVREQVDFLGHREIRWKLVGPKRRSHRRRTGDQGNGFAGFTPDIEPRALNNVADKFVKVLGMLGSDHDGERASAASAADKLRKQSGLTWAEIVRGYVRGRRAQSAPATGAKPSASRSTGQKNLPQGGKS